MAVSIPATGTLRRCLPQQPPPRKGGLTEEVHLPAGRAAGTAAAPKPDQNLVGCNTVNIAQAIHPPTLGTSLLRVPVIIGSLTIRISAAPSWRAHAAAVNLACTDCTLTIRPVSARVTHQVIARPLTRHILDDAAINFRPMPTPATRSLQATLRLGSRPCGDLQRRGAPHNRDSLIGTSTRRPTAGIGATSTALPSCDVLTWAADVHRINILIADDSPFRLLLPTVAALGSPSAGITAG